MTKLKIPNHFQPKRGTLWALALMLTFAFIAGCGSTPNTTRETPTAQAPAPVKADPFAVLDEQAKTGNIDPHVFQERVDAARQEWLRALVAQQKNEKTEVVKHFESAIDILNRLITYPGIDSNTDFKDVSKSVIGDYEKYIARIDSLPSNASIFAFREKFNQEMTKMDIKNVPLPRIDLSKTQIPLTINTDVEQSIAYFTEGNGRPFMERWLARTGRYFPMMKEIMKEEKVPEEIIHLAMMESGLNPAAVSWAKAVGMWQFIDATGSTYGLHSNWWFDMRRDPVAATRAAARFLRDLDNQLGDWHLALAAYDCGANRILQAEAEANSKSYWDIRPFLPKETQRYVPLFIATTLISMDPVRYGFNNIVYEQPIKFDTVHLREAIDLKAVAKAAGVSDLEVKELNPELLQPSTPPLELCSPDGYCLRLPAGASPSFYERLAAIPASERRPWLVHTVARGETMRSIARLYGIGTDQLAEYNDLSAGAHVKRGEHLRVPMTVMAPQTASSEETASAQTSEVVQPNATPTRVPIEQAANTGSSKLRLIKHRVRHGETLNSIAAANGVSVSSLRKWNDLSRHSKLRKGEMLKIYETSIVSAAKPDTQHTELAASNKKAKQTTKWVTYHVRRGDTMGKIADNFGVSLSELRSWNPGVRRTVRQGQALRVHTTMDNAADNADMAQASKPAGSPTYHTVLPGETLTAIAHKFGTTPNDLSDWNDGLKADNLQAGTKIKVYVPNITPSQGDRVLSQHTPTHPLTYRVKPGDTLTTIADEFGVGVREIKRVNHLHSSLLMAGLRLRIP
jgi:membrane-bound lytic murein transglycosylase D